MLHYGGALRNIQREWHASEHGEGTPPSLADQTTTQLTHTQPAPLAALSLSGAETEGETPMPPTTGDAATPESGDDDVQTGTDGKLPDTSSVDNGRSVKLPLFLKWMKNQLKRGLSEITNDLNEDA